MKVGERFLHFIYGVFITISVALWFDNSLYGFISSIVVGALKEIYDYYVYGHGDFLDFLYTANGASFGVFILWLIDKFL